MVWVNAKEDMPPKFDLGRGWYVKINGAVKVVLSHDEILKKIPYCGSIMWLNEAKASANETIDQDNETMMGKVAEVIEDHLLETLKGASRLRETLKKITS